jgi:hypothetical protein
MAWIPSHQEIGRHPKTRKLARTLGVTVPTAVGHLHLLWHWAFSYAPTGDLTGHDVEDIADGAMWTDEPDTFVKALVKTGWADANGDRIVLHDWDDYAGKYDQRRSRADGLFGNHVRWHQQRDVVDPDCPHCRPPTTPTHAPDSGPPSAPDSADQSPPESPPDSPPNRPPIGEANRRLEKRREEKKNKTPPSGELRARARATQLPQDWQPSPTLHTWATDTCPYVNLTAETAKFADHWRSKGERRVDWDATWRNWIRRAAETPPRNVRPLPNTHNGNGRSDRLRDAAAHLREQGR